MKRSKNYRAVREKVDRNRHYPLDEAIKIVKEGSFVKFDETIEAAARLGVDPKHADQMVRGTVSLPHGTGKTIRVLVFADGEKAEEARKAGADFVGEQDLVDKIQGGWLGFDVAVATPNMMKIVGRLGKILGSRGLMPNPKSGTVTMDIEKTVGELKAGRIEYRVDRLANIAVPVGKVSFSEEQIKENYLTFIKALVKARPASVKGTYMKSLAICSTMGPGLKLDHQAILQELKK
jgi:large subunit ribosomal protein L1